ncbi:MAG: putative O-glycosylation ligase, exosortase A system-associated [Alphaproteobacteria bacterium]|nr:putative O-glycosylation ligase, exosortase A system-associated [Alphaproteobacteria bacterium]MBV8380875.1 putative O-glycosylation ligase, exosortase A system-associated [Roseateles sp.]
MRDLVVLVFLMFYAILALRNFYVSYLLWGWSGLMAVNDYAYGFLSTMPIGMIFAIISLSSLFLNRNKLAKKYGKGALPFWFVAFGLHGVLSAASAFPNLPRNWEICINLTKTLLFCLCMPWLVVDRLRVHALIVTVAVAVGFHGFVEGAKFVASLGQHLSLGISQYGDNNHFAMVLAMNIPLLIYLVKYSNKKLVQLGFISVLILNVFAIVSTGSRGGLVALLVLMLWQVLASKNKVAGLLLAGTCAVLVMGTASDRWKDRMDTIASAETDSSFLGRVLAWKHSAAIGFDHPFVGGGFRAVQDRAVWDRYDVSHGIFSSISTAQVEATLQFAKAAHSIYFEVLGDQGVLGLMIFVMIFVVALVTGRHVRMNSNKKGQIWIADLAGCISVSLVVYLVGGALLSAAYFELPYILCMILFALRNVSANEKPDSPAVLAGATGYAVA